MSVNFFIILTLFLSSLILQLKFFQHVITCTNMFSVVDDSEAQLQLKCIQIVVLVMLAYLPLVFNVIKIGEIINCQLKHFQFVDGV